MANSATWPISGYESMGHVHAILCFRCSDVTSSLILWNGPTLLSKFLDLVHQTVLFFVFFHVRITDWRGEFSIGRPSLIITLSLNKLP